MIDQNFRLNRGILPIPLKGGWRVFHAEEIISFVSEKSGTYINSIHIEDNTVCEISLTTLDEYFASHGFFRIHENCLVNTWYIKSLNRTADKQLLMRDGTRYCVSRRNISRLEEAMLHPHDFLKRMGTNRGLKPARYWSNATIRGILAHPLWIALYLWRILYETTPTDSFLL
jgi:hypothetical protein